MATEYGLLNFIDDEIKEGTSFEEILENFDLTPGEVFVHLYESGLIDDQVLEGFMLNFE